MKSRYDSCHHTIDVDDLSGLSTGKPTFCRVINADLDSLIAVLQEIREKHGNRPVYHYDTDRCACSDLMIDVDTVEDDPTNVTVEFY